MKKVAILQPNYIPWKGYFDIINMVDEFIVYDEVQYTKNDWRNRNKIKTKNGLLWLTIPVRRRSLDQKISETKALNSMWRKKHWKSLCQWYSKSKYFETYRSTFEKLYLSSVEDNLSKINVEFIDTINAIVGIKTKLRTSSHYELYGGKTDRLINICKQANATEYITGPSAMNYLDVQRFKESNIELRFVSYEGYKPYHQQFPPFEHGVSIVDLIFNTGPSVGRHINSFN